MRGATRTFIHEQPPGALYIYLNYGVHWLLNFLTKEGDMRGFVLIRALQPMLGLDVMRRRRRLDRDRMLCSGPGKLTQALGITAQWHGKDFFSIPGVSLTRNAKRPIIAVDRMGTPSRGRDLSFLPSTLRTRGAIVPTNE